MFYKKEIIVLGLLVLLASCGEEKPKSIFENMPAKELKKRAMEANRLKAKKEKIQIQQYAEQMKWPTTVSGTGIHCWIYAAADTTAQKARPGKIAEVNMIISLMNGDTCYSYKNYGSEEFLIERDNIESGLHEAIQNMRVGEKAKIILPSNLAHGVAGDRNKIPPLSSVVYDIELLKLK